MGSVTISATYGARGDAIGHEVATRLGVPFLDRAIPAAVARQLHLSEVDAETLDQRAPSRWDQIATSLSRLDPSAAGAAFPIKSSESFRLATEAVLRQVAEGGGGVLLGRAGMVVLADRPDVLRVRLDGPLEARIAQVVADGTAEAVARETQRDVDAARHHYASYFYNCRQDDPSLYHLIIDSTALPADVCADLITTAARALFESTPTA